MLPRRPDLARVLEQLVATTNQLLQAVAAADWDAAQEALAQRGVELAALRQAAGGRLLSGLQVEQLEAILRTGQEAARRVAAERDGVRAQLASLGAARLHLASWAPKLPEREPNLDLTG